MSPLRTGAQVLPHKGLTDSHESVLPPRLPSDKPKTPRKQADGLHELDRLAEAWPGLSEAVRREILRLAGVLR